MHKANGTGKSAAASRGKGFLTRLGRDTRGNTLAILGAALVPLAAMIGSGVDMSRAYMAKNRLQSACDAAALAGRRVMTNDTLNATVTNEARRFFDFNFPQNTYDTTTFTPVITRPEAGTVRVAASTRIPTAIMQLFGFDSLPLSVTCDATLNFVNTDVMLVLDVTGSMDENLGGTKKIVALRDAVMALYDELRPIQTQLEANGLRLRYGVVPYSSTVNVGALIREQNPDFLLDNVDYQSRESRYDLTTFVPESPEPPNPPMEQIYAQSLTSSDCDKYGRNVAFSGFTPSASTGGGPAPTPTWTRTFSNNESSGVDWGWPGAADRSTSKNDNKMTCRRRYVQTNTEYETRFRYNGTNYVQESVDVSQFKLGNAVQIASLSSSISNDGNVANDGYVSTAGTYDAHELAQLGEQVTVSNVTWNGCIEERRTVNTITSTSSYTLPTNAWDLNINAVPTEDGSDDLRWRPMFPQLVYSRTAGSNSATSGTSMSTAACPAAARRLQAWQRTDMLGYVNALQPTGSTYHDTGMIWGARMISNGGIFADSPDNFNAMPVSRHIIFMSDGQMDTDRGVYGLYGVEQNDQRISGMANPSETELNGRHMQRFKMVCNAARGMNVSIWVIAFGTTLSAEMTACATNANQASTVGNRDQLIARFRQIGSNIGALRLTQ